MDCGMRTTDCGLGIKYGLGIKRGLENIDWVYNADCGLQTGYKIQTTDYVGKNGANCLR